MHTAQALLQESPGGSALAATIRERFGDRVRLRAEVPASRVTTLGAGGVLSLVGEPRDMETVSELLAFLHDAEIPWRVLGAGSNLVVCDDGISDFVIHFGAEFSGFTFAEEPVIDPVEGWKRSQIEPSGALSGTSGAFVFALAGAPLIGLSRKTSQWGLSGLEFAAGIPASVGGAVRMNAGAHGSSISDVLTSVVLVRPGGALETIAAEDIQFEYRKSSLPERSLILGAMFSLPCGDSDSVMRRRAACLEYRKRTQPLQLPSAGSVFRNPVHLETPVAAGKLIEESGLKGMRSGNAAISELHANWIVRVGDGNSVADVLTLMNLAREEVLGRFGIGLEREIVVW